jgi:hypothetical protein
MDIQSILEMIKLVGAAAGAILSIIALITALSKNQNSGLLILLKKLQKMNLKKFITLLRKQKLQI